MTEIVINHLTRMKAPRICIAGIEPATGDHVRPVTGPEEWVSRALLRRAGGVCDLGVRIDLGDTDPRPVPPEVEDRVFDPAAVVATATLLADDYLSLIDEVCVDTFGEIFGPQLERDGHSFSMAEGSGKASLGCIRLRTDRFTELSIDRYGSVRLRLRGSGSPAYLKVNDLRFYARDQKTPIQDTTVAVQRRIAKGVPLRLMVGLTRPYPHKGGRKHWLQVNGVCLEDSPLGDTP